MGLVPKIVVRLEYPSQNFSEMSFVTSGGKTRKCRNKDFVTGSRPGIVWAKKDMLNFGSDPLTCDAALFHTKNELNCAKSNPIFPGKGRRYRDLILIYLHSPMAKIFSRNF